MSSQPNDWGEILSPELDKQYFRDLCDFIDSERELGKEIYPSDDDVVRALELCSFEDVQVVILGQDPYYNPGQADGLAFSVPNGVKIPPSLANIFKEINSDLGEPIPTNGDLTIWAKDGVLLLNTVLTVERGKPNSHKGIGWETFTDHIVREVSNRKSGVVFLLWGKNAQKKEKLIDSSKHHILKAAHPSPLSARKGFFGCGHFSKVEQLLGDS